MRAWLALLALSLFLVGSGTFDAQAQTAASSPCDMNYYKSLKARAWLEAQREITQNQNLIYKPDSVLEYTCFDRFLNVLSQQSLTMFSGNARWGATSTNMQSALQNLVGNPMRNYITSNFQQSGTTGTYPLLGGRSPSGLDHRPPFTVTGGSYTCSIMNDVWMEAKCMDFIANEDKDGFYTFNEYIGHGQDRRHLPAACQPFDRARWQTAQNEAFVPASTPWTEDHGPAFLNELRASHCSNSTPLKTNLIVMAANGVQYDEHVCVPPGCTYNHTSGRCTPTP